MSEEKEYSNIYEILMKEIKVQEKKHKIYMDKDYKEEVIEFLLMNVVEELQHHGIRTNKRLVKKQVAFKKIDRSKKALQAKSSNK